MQPLARRVQGRPPIKSISTCCSVSAGPASSLLLHISVASQARVENEAPLCAPTLTITPVVNFAVNWPAPSLQRTSLPWQWPIPRIAQRQNTESSALVRTPTGKPAQATVDPDRIASGRVSGFLSAALTPKTSRQSKPKSGSPSSPPASPAHPAWPDRCAVPEPARQCRQSASQSNPGSQNRTAQTSQS